MILHSVVLQEIMIHGEEEDVDDDAERDEQLSEGVKDDEGHDLADTDPAAAAVPYAEDVNHVLQIAKQGHLNKRRFLL